MSELSERLKKAIKDSGLSQRELEIKTGIPHSAIQRYASGTTDRIPISRIKTLANALGTTAEYILGWDKSTPQFANNIIPFKTKKVPLLGTIACGEPILAEEEHGSFVSVSEDLQVDFCLLAKGDSMIGAHISDGDVVFIRQQEEVRNGEIAAVIIDNEATLKRVFYYKEQNKMVLWPENTAYEPLVYMGSELEQIRIIGKAVAFQSLIK